jgi:hypothetical protein
VKLELDTNRFDLSVGAQLRREENGPWQFREQAENLAFSGTRSDIARSDSRGFDSRRGDSRGGSSNDRGRTASTPAPTVKLSAEEESEILKRLMQKREQENK